MISIVLAYLHLCNVYTCLCINTFEIYTGRNLYFYVFTFILCFMILVFTLEEILLCFGRTDNSKTSNQAKGVSELLGGVISHKHGQGRTGVNSYFQKHELALTHSHWQVI